MRGAVNNRIFDALSWRKAHSALRHPRFHHGFNDYMADLPFDYRLLDGWTLLEQHRYENGQEIAAECRVAGLAVRWADRNRIPWELKALVVGRIRSRRNGPHPGKQRELGSRRLEAFLSTGGRHARPDGHGAHLHVGCFYEHLDTMR